MFHNSKDVTSRAITEELNDTDLEKLHCDLCSEGGWTSETEVEIHKGLIHVDQITELVSKNTNYCRMCITNCNNREDLLTHIKEDHLWSSGNSCRVQRDIFICDYCGQIFFNKRLLCVHIRHVHFKNNNMSKSSIRIICPRCGKSVRQETIWFHFQGHSLQSISACPICLVKCLNKKHLKLHMKKHTKVLKCDICLYETKREEYFDMHIQNRHKKTLEKIDITDYKQYFIPGTERCWKYLRFTQIKGLQLTNGVHVCILCKEICAGDDEMKNHIAVEHKLIEEPKINQHACSCGEVYTNKVLLKHHLFKLKGDHKMLGQ